jgi:DNA-binding MarR family transcriptional regulator
MTGDDLSMGYLMHWGARMLRRLIDRKLRPIGLSSGHLPVINALVAGEPMSQKALAEAASIEQPTMAATLARLERDGIVERRPDPRDRRVALFSLTPATREKIAAVRQAVEEVNAEALSGLPTDQRRRFRRQLEEMNRAMEKRLGGDIL